VEGLPRRSADITDGVSCTVLVGEKAMELQAYDTGGWYFDEPIFSGGSAGTARNGTVIVPDTDRSGAFPYHWGAPHLSGAQFVRADGSVRDLRFGLSAEIVMALLTPGGGELPPSMD